MGAIILAVLAALALSLTATPANAATIRDDNQTVTDQRYVSTFDEIENITPFTVSYVQAANQEVVVEGDYEAVKHLRTSVAKGCLRIFMDNGRFKNVKAHVYVTAPYVTELRVLGSGDIVCESQILINDDLDIDIVGSGDIVAGAVACDALDANVNGSGDIRIEVLNSKDADLTVTGSGDIAINNLTVEGDLDMSIVGSGDIEVNGKAHSVDAKIVGSGDIKGYLTPDKITTNTTGSGRISLLK